MDGNYNVTRFSKFQNTFILGRLRLANFVVITKIATMFIRTTFKNLSKVKIIKSYAYKRSLYLYYLI